MPLFLTEKRYTVLYSDSGEAQDRQYAAIAVSLFDNVYIKVTQLLFIENLSIQQCYNLIFFAEFQRIYTGTL